MAFLAFGSPPYIYLSNGELPLSTVRSKLPIAIVAFSIVTGPGPKAPPNTALISWQAAGSTTYRIECRSTVDSPWMFLTNYTHGPKKGMATFADPLHTNGTCFYRVLYFQ